MHGMKQQNVCRLLPTNAVPCMHRCYRAKRHSQMCSAICGAIMYEHDFRELPIT